MSVRLTVHFAGRVQGVGFRWNAVDVAQQFAAAGYVMNLPDGRVRLVVEGRRDELHRLVAAIRARMANHISNVSLDESPANGEFGEAEAGAVVVRRI